MIKIMNKPEIVVIGAGVFGLSTSYNLALNGYEVLLIDKSFPGSEASGKAMGRLDPILGGVGSTLEKANSLGRPDYQKELSEESFKLHLNNYKDLIKSTMIDYNFQSIPTLQIIDSENELTQLIDLIPEWNQKGFNSKIITDQYEFIDSRINLNHIGLVLINGVVFLDSLKFCQSLIKTCEISGVKFENFDVTTFSNTKNGIEITNKDQIIRPKKVVISTGPWTNFLTEQIGVSIDIKPLKGEMLKVEPFNEPLEFHLHGKVSICQKLDNLLWIGATKSNYTFNSRKTKKAQDELIYLASEIIPEIINNKIVDHSVCFRPMTPDAMPAIGPIDADKNIWIASGGGGWGILHSFNIGQEITRMIKENTDISSFSGINVKRLIYN